MILGEFTSDGRPTILAIISLPEINAHGPVKFLFDTGATKTVIHPNDAEILGIDFGKLKNETYSSGIGGRAKVFMEKAELVFREVDGQTLRRHPLDIAIAGQSLHNRNYPSLLGRDILNQWTMLYDPRNNILNLVS